MRDPKKDPEPWLDAARTKALERLRSELWKHAQAHGGFFPTSRFELAVPDQVWQGISPDNSSFAYVGGLQADHGKSIVVYESNVYGSERYVLRCDGEISKMKAEGLAEELKKQMDQIYTANGKAENSN